MVSPAGASFSPESGGGSLRRGKPVLYQPVRPQGDRTGGRLPAARLEQLAQRRACFDVDLACLDEFSPGRGFLLAGGGEFLLRRGQSFLGRLAPGQGGLVADLRGAQTVMRGIGGAPRGIDRGGRFAAVTNRRLCTGRDGDRGQQRERKGTAQFFCIGRHSHASGAIGNGRMP